MDHILLALIPLIVLAALIFMCVKSTKALWRKQDEQRNKNNQAIKDWLTSKRNIISPGNPMYHEDDVRRLINILRPLLNID